MNDTDNRIRAYQAEMDNLYRRSMMAERWATFFLAGTLTGWGLVLLLLLTR